jgi:hypothetical protein
LLPVTTPLVEVNTTIYLQILDNQSMRERERERLREAKVHPWLPGTRKPA